MPAQSLPWWRLRLPFLYQAAQDNPESTEACGELAIAVGRILLLDEHAFGLPIMRPRRSLQALSYLMDRAAQLMDLLDDLCWIIEVFPEDIFGFVDTIVSVRLDLLAGLLGIAPALQEHQHRHYQSLIDAHGQYSDMLVDLDKQIKRITPALYAMDLITALSNHRDTILHPAVRSEGWFKRFINYCKKQSKLQQAQEDA